MDTTGSTFELYKTFHNIFTNISPGSSPMILSSFRIFSTTFWDAKLYSKGSRDIWKEPGMESQLVAWSVDSEVGFMEGSWMSQTNMHPGEWLNAREGSRKMKKMKVSRTTDKRI